MQRISNGTCATDPHTSGNSCPRRSGNSCPRRQLGFTKPTKTLLRVAAAAMRMQPCLMLQEMDGEEPGAVPGSMYVSCRDKQCVSGVTGLTC